MYIYLKRKYFTPRTYNRFLLHDVELSGQIIS